MARFHTSTDGVVGVCRARVRCIYGDLDRDHFNTEEKALKNYELYHKAEPLKLTDETRDLLYELGARQLPNKSYASLRESLHLEKFSEYNLEAAHAALEDEFRKLSEILEKPSLSWSFEEVQAADKLGPVVLALRYFSFTLSKFRDKRAADLFEV